jgi:hypothetical protein
MFSPQKVLVKWVNYFLIPTDVYSQKKKGATWRKKQKPFLEIENAVTSL